MSVGQRPFCRDPFFDLDLVWNTTDPNVTQCMRDTLLVGVPCILFLIASLIWSIYQTWTRGRASTVSSKYGPLFLAKFTFTLVILVNLLGQFCYTSGHVGGSDKLVPSELFHYPCLLVFVGLALLQTAVDKFLGAHISPPLFLFWLALLICEIPKLKIDIQSRMVASGTVEEWVLLITYVPIILGLFIAHCWVDIDPRAAEDLSLEDKASCLSLLVFSWLDGLLWQGHKTPLKWKNLPKSPRSMNVTDNVKAFTKQWRKQAEDKLVDFTSPIRPFVSLWPILFKNHGWRALIALIVALFRVLLPFVSPQIIKLLIKHMDSNEPVWQGFFYTIVLLFSSLLSTMAFHAYQQHLHISAIQMRNSLLGALYQKSLRLSNKARRLYSVGEMTNYMSVDAQRIVETFPYMMGLIMSPLTILIAMYFLFTELNVASLAGLVVFAIFIPINLFGSKCVKKLQVQQLQAKDTRLKLMNELLMGIKVLKLYAWEIPFMRRIYEIRLTEIKIIKMCGRLWAFINFSYCSSPILVTIGVFGIYVAMDPTHVLTADKIFVAIALFNLMRSPLVSFPFTLIESVKVFVSLKRINEFLNASEIDSTNVIHTANDLSPHAIEMTEATLTWDSDDGVDPILSQMNLSIPCGSLTAIVGTVGAGKSSLLSSFLGEMEKLSGQVQVRGSIAYVPQQAWIQNMTLRDNILFDQEFSSTNYTKVIRDCQLEPDLAILKHRDRTEIGENGINLSGGQKQRVSLARAVYSDADIYLLDDPLSAVDAHVGKAIFTQVLDSTEGCLKDKTRVLVTHNVNFLDKMDNIIVLKNGKVAESGSYQKLLADGKAFSEFLIQYTSNPVTSEVETDELKVLATTTKEPPKREVRVPSEEVESPEETDNLIEETADDLIEEEKTVAGRVGAKVYWTYVQSIGTSQFFTVVFLYGLASVVHALANYWLSRWADHNEAHPETGSDRTGFYLGVYGGIGVVQLILDFSRELLHIMSCAQASKVIHDKLLQGVMRSPMAFFDTNPTGRIVNRFSSDIDGVDQVVPAGLSDIIWCAFDTLSVIVVVCSSTPIFASVIIPLGLIYFFVQRFFVIPSQQIKRAESVTKSAIFAHFSETITGLASIRAYQQQDRFLHESQARVQKCTNCTFLNVSANRWLGLRVEVLGNLVVFFAAIFAVLSRENLSPGIAGLSITYALGIMDTLNWMIRMLCELETNSVALERILEYTHNESEAEWDLPLDPKVGHTWPTEGAVSFKSYATRYRNGLDLVLKGIDMEVRSNEKIGICGRTGAGKSSLTLSLFRIIEAVKGRILIDGQDIAQLGLHTLRSRITIIPQDPVLFTGNLRFNLDPNEIHSDGEIWSALDHAHLKGHISDLKLGLYHEISEGGENFSVGQRQLICLARALLRKTKILVLDEATAAVDLVTDDLIQSTIRREFEHCTVITIAHRLNTILDCDRIAVFSHGQIAEFGSPAELLANPTSALKAMKNDAGL
eukprot:snap_masked-scaffold1304_size49437-processed-gene-0.4 protein:Tk12175 transcript:snap_masked-scaffold1304_size49437-processed-gene-0.4-mRNA-1 annotation:"multidrug resistance-associated protein 1 isoform x3"